MIQGGTGSSLAGLQNSVYQLHGYAMNCVQLKERWRVGDLHSTVDICVDGLAFS